MKVLNLFGKSVVSIAVIAAFYGANAAENGRVGIMSAGARMPTIPTVGHTTIGNTAVTTVNQPAQTNYAQPVVPTNPQPQPQPTTKCPDGGVENSTYTVTNCMNDILQCINTGALQGGLNDLFNEDVRNSIMTGMKLCQVHVDKCISEVRVNCNNIYHQSSDVWLDFNSRVIQPEYYNFVLRKTGLTPNQAENTCLLLDRNTYGSSFAAVSDTNVVNTEYDNRVGAYNSANNGTLSKNKPQGVEVNTTGYDGNRGHYARWDAAKAECLVRVAAYNKDKLITNSWLFGAVGDDNPAEVWEKAGSTFTCNKDLFDFSSLLNDTKTAAVVGIGGGTVLGTAIGAAAGAGAYKNKHEAYLKENDAHNNPCSDPEYVKTLGGTIYTSGKGGVLKSYANESISVTESGGVKHFTATPIFEENYNFNDLDEEKCEALYLLREKVIRYKSLVKECTDNENNKKIHNAIIASSVKIEGNAVIENIELVSGKIQINGVDTCTAPAGITASDVEFYAKKCLFVPLRIQDEASTTGALCNHSNQCLDVSQITHQVDELSGLLDVLKKVMGKAPTDVDKGKEIGKGAAIGAATGAAAGGLATAITAFVEKNNISCKVGDGLHSVSLGKSYTIDSLKDFYVKWNLHLPDTITPTSAVVDRASWEQACSQFNNNLMDCPKVQINLKDASGKITLIPSACKISGSICVIDDIVAASHGI